MKIANTLKLSLLGAFVVCVGVPAQGAALCESLVGQPDYKIRACELSVMGFQYRLRNWYPQAIQKATVAHILDFTNPRYINEVAQYSELLIAYLKTNSVDKVQGFFPELAVTDSEDQIAQGVAFARRRDLATGSLEFSVFVQDVVGASTWEARIAAGDPHVAALKGEQLRRFVRFLDFVFGDLDFATDYNIAGLTPALTCSVLLPLQFGYTSKALMPLMLAASSYPVESGCREEAYRAILFQAFTVVGGSMLDSEYNTILRVANSSGAESLSNPTPVLQRLVADSKLIRAFVDSVKAVQTATGRTDISKTVLDRIVARYNVFLDNLGVDTTKKIAVYKSIAGYASSKSDLINLRLGARFADEVKILEGRR